MKKQKNKLLRGLAVFLAGTLLLGTGAAFATKPEISIPDEMQESLLSEGALEEASAEMPEGEVEILPEEPEIPQELFAEEDALPEPEDLVPEEPEPDTEETGMENDMTALPEESVLVPQEEAEEPVPEEIAEEIAFEETSDEGNTAKPIKDEELPEPVSPQEESSKESLPVGYPTEEIPMPEDLSLEEAPADDLQILSEEEPSFLPKEEGAREDIPEPESKEQTEETEETMDGFSFSAYSDLSYEERMEALLEASRNDISTASAVRYASQLDNLGRALYRVMQSHVRKLNTGETASLKNSFTIKQKITIPLPDVKQSALKKNIEDFIKYWLAAEAFSALCGDYREEMFWIYGVEGDIGSVKYTVGTTSVTFTSIQGSYQFLADDTFKASATTVNRRLVQSYQDAYNRTAKILTRADTLKTDLAKLEFFKAEIDKGSIRKEVLNGSKNVLFQFLCDHTTFQSCMVSSYGERSSGVLVVSLSGTKHLVDIEHGIFMARPILAMSTAGFYYFYTPNKKTAKITMIKDLLYADRWFSPASYKELQNGFHAYTDITGKKVLGYVYIQSGKIAGTKVVKDKLNGKSGLYLLVNGVFADYFNGTMVCGNGAAYYCKKGIPQTGLIKDSQTGHYYYGSKNSGVLVKNKKVTVGKKVYYFGPDRSALTGLQKLDSHYYYFDSAGVMLKSGWKTIKGHKYYFGSDGQAFTGIHKIKSKLYYFSKTGKMQTDCKKKYKGKWYYFGKDGVGKKTS